MKQIKIQHFKAPDQETVFIKRNQYKITLGNDYQVYFTDKRHVSAFFNQTNQFLNGIFYELNICYTEVHELYRSAWIYFDKAKYRKIQDDIDQELESITKNFDLLFSRSHLPNGNYLTWQFLYRIINSLMEILESLQPFYTYRKQHDRIIKIKLLHQTLEAHHSTLQLYPETEQKLKEKIKALIV